MIIVGMWHTILTVVKNQKNYDHKCIVYALIKLLQTFHIDKWVKFEMFWKPKATEQDKHTDKEEVKQNEILQLEDIDLDQIQDLDLDFFESQEASDQEMKEDDEEMITFREREIDNESQIKSFREELDTQEYTSHDIVNYIWEIYEDLWSNSTKEDFLNLSPAMLILIIRALMKDKTTDIHTNTKRIVALSVSANTKLEDEETKKIHDYARYSMWILYEILTFKNIFLLTALHENDNNKNVGNYEKNSLGNLYSKIDLCISYLDNIFGTEQDLSKICKSVLFFKFEFSLWD